MALVAASMVPSCVCHASWCSTRVVTIVFGMMGRPSGSRGKAMNSDEAGQRGEPLLGRLAGGARWGPQAHRGQHGDYQTVPELDGHLPTVLGAPDARRPGASRKARNQTCRLGREGVPERAVPALTERGPCGARQSRVPTARNGGEVQVHSMFEPSGPVAGPPPTRLEPSRVQPSGGAQGPRRRPR
jgi:hypothetical protein